MMNFILLMIGFGFGTAFALSETKKTKVIIASAAIVASLCEVFLLPK